MTSVIAECLIALVFAAAPASGFNKVASDPVWVALNRVVIDKSLSREDKIAAIEKHFHADPKGIDAARWIGRVDPAEAKKRMRAEFENPQRDVAQRLRIVHTLATRGPYRLDGFIQHCAPWLISEVLKGGDQFDRKLELGTLTAIGEYTCLAAGFEGYDAADFAKAKDKRVIPVLVRALGAPDNVWPADQGDCFLGNPGEPSGRNVPRQLVPIALARLDATEAIDTLRRALREHHDWHLRNNAAYALGLLENPADHAALVEELRSRNVVNARGRVDAEKDRYRHLYAFGRGLLQRGDHLGIEFMAFKYSVYASDDQISGVAYMLEKRLEDLKSIRSPKLELFFRQAFNHEPMMGLFLLDERKVKPNGDGHNGYGFDRAGPRIAAMFDSACEMIEANHLTTLRPTIQQISRQSASEVIRRRAEQCAAKLTGPLRGQRESQRLADPRYLPFSLAGAGAAQQFATL